MINGMDAADRTAVTDTRPVLLDPSRVGSATALRGAALAVVGLGVPYWAARFAGHGPENRVCTTRRTLSRVALSGHSTGTTLVLPHSLRTLIENAIIETWGRVRASGLARPRRGGRELFSLWSEAEIVLIDSWAWAMSNRVRT
jgi:hypothetical protein